MKVVFIGASKFGLRCLEKITTLADCTVVGVVTAPEKFSISYSPQGVTNVLYADVSQFCRINNVPCETIVSGMKDKELLRKVTLWQPDIMVVSGWYHMVPKNWRDVAPCYGLHASLLPDYSGGAPLVWAIINGEKTTGISFFEFAGGVDNGPIVAQARTFISDDDTIATLYARVEELGLELIETNLPHLARGVANLQAQDEARRRVFPQRKPDDGLIDWRQPAKVIYDFVRAQSRPYPGAFTLINGQKMTVWRVTRSGQPCVGQSPGTLFQLGGRVYAVCGDNEAIEIHAIAVDGVDCDIAGALHLVGHEVEQHS